MDDSAHNGEEGRGKLRYAQGRRMQPLILRFLNVTSPRVRKDSDT